MKDGNLIRLRGDQLRQSVELLLALGEHKREPSLAKLREHIGCNPRGAIPIGRDGTKHFLDTRIRWKRREVERRFPGEQNPSGGGLHLGGGGYRMPGWAG